MHVAYDREEVWNALNRAKSDHSIRDIGRWAGLTEGQIRSFRSRRNLNDEAMERLVDWLVAGEYLIAPRDPMEFAAIALANLSGFLRNGKVSAGARLDALEDGVAAVTRLFPELRRWAGKSPV